jgi:hypothetical protein
MANVPFSPDMLPPQSEDFSYVDLSFFRPGPWTDNQNMDDPDPSWNTMPWYGARHWMDLGQPDMPSRSRALAIAKAVISITNADDILDHQSPQHCIFEGHITPARQRKPSSKAM